MSGSSLGGARAARGRLAMHSRAVVELERALGALTDPRLLAKHAPLVEALTGLREPAAGGVSEFGASRQGHSRFAWSIDPRRKKEVHNEFQSEQRQVFSSTHAKNAASALKLLDRLERRPPSTDPRVHLTMRRNLKHVSRHRFIGGSSALSAGIGESSAAPPRPEPPVLVDSTQSSLRLSWPAEERADVLYQMQVARLDPSLGAQPFEAVYTGRKTEFRLTGLPQHGWECPGPIEVRGCYSDYRVRIVAINSFGRSAPSCSVFASPKRIGRRVMLELTCTPPHPDSIPHPSPSLP